MDVASSEIHIREVGTTGRVTLTRPQSLNALSHEMAIAIEAALRRWQTHTLVERVVIDAMGGKAFCAGGDLAAMYRAGSSGDFDACRQFWAHEYQLNVAIKRCSIPYVALMDGYVMGGGVGISSHGSHRVVTERSQVAMPECAIGMVPDVGGTFLLSRAPGHLGEFLAATGWRMSASDAIWAGFADLQISSGDIPLLVDLLETDGDMSSIEGFRQQEASSPLLEHMETIGQHFSKPTAIECLVSLEEDPDEFAQRAAILMRRACPLSLACAYQLVRRARHLETIEEAIAAEHRFTYRSMSEGQFLEGIRAQIVDKDRNPRWRPDRLEDVTCLAVERMLAPLGEAELALWGGSHR